MYLEKLLKSVVTLDDKWVETHEVFALLTETLLAGGKLKNFGDGSEITALVVVKIVIDLFVDHIKPIGSDNGRVDVPEDDYYQSRALKYVVMNKVYL